MLYPLTRCSLSKQPVVPNKPVNKKDLLSHAESGLRLRVVVGTHSSATVSIIAQSGTIFERVIPPLPSPSNGPSFAPLPRLVMNGPKGLLKVPNARGLEDLCQVTFASEQAAGAASAQLRNYFDLTDKGAKPPQAPQPPVAAPGLHNAPTQNATPKPPPLAATLITPYVALQQQQSTELPVPTPESQIQSQPQSQPFIETQYPSTFEDSQPPAAQVEQKHPRSSSEVPESLDAEDLLGSEQKKRRLDGPAPDSRSGSSGTYHSSSTTAYENLIDLNEDEHRDQSSSVLQDGYPALDPYEGTAWGNMAQASQYACPAGRTNSYITEGVYGMTEAQLEAAIDEVSTEAGFQSMCERLVDFMHRRQVDAEITDELDEYEDAGQGDHYYMATR